jgi:hypothetical protein
VRSRAAQTLQRCADQWLSCFDGLLLAVAELREVADLVTVDGGHFRGLRLAHVAAITVV